MQSAEHTGLCCLQYGQWVAMQGKCIDQPYPFMQPRGGGGGPLMSGKVEQTRLITRDFVGNGCCSTSGSNVVVEQFQGPDENM